MRRSLVISMTVILIVALASAAMAVQCQNRSRPCLATTSVTLYTGTPIPICYIGVPIVQISTTANCFSIAGGGGGSASSGVFIKCGADDDGYTWTGAGYEHQISLYPGQEWQDVYGGRCKAVIYKTNRL